VRVVFTNAYGTAPLTIGAAHIALRSNGNDVQVTGSRPVTFNGRRTIAVPPHSVMYSDPVNLAVSPFSDLAIDLYLPETTDTVSPVTMHVAALQTSYVSEAGNHTGAATFATVSPPIRSWFYLARVEVDAPAAVGAIVALGDSITDFAATNDTNTRWSDFLARRLSVQRPATSVGVLNAGLGGNQLLANGNFYGAGFSALSRFDADVLNQTGTTHVIVLDGINDIGQAGASLSPTADDIITGYRQLIDRGHAKGVTVLGATLTPFFGGPYFNEISERKRQAVNDWIRKSGAYDGVIDFDAALRDPSDPKRLLPVYDSGDHLHPSEAGYKAMAEAIDVRMLRERVR
jgi:lysophospholipase L1-like esterase